MCIETHSRVYTCFSDRLLSFKNWPGTQSPQSMASAGFFYINPDDDVQCFYCGIRIAFWEPSDIPLSEHLRWSKDCVFANLLLKNQTTTAVSDINNQTIATNNFNFYILLCASIMYYLDIPTGILLFAYFLIFYK